MKPVSFYKFAKLSLVAVLLYGFGYSIFVEPEPIQRQIASDPDAFRIDWSSSSGLPPSSEQEFVIEAQIEPLVDISKGTSYRWILPSDVKVISGSTQDELYGLKKNQKANLRISVMGISQESGPRTIMIEIGSTDKEKSYRTFSRFNSEVLLKRTATSE